VRERAGLEADPELADSARIEAILSSVRFGATL
jgi:hypothetical protein